MYYTDVLHLSTYIYYNSHLKQTEITKIIGVSTQYISKIVKKDSRYEQEKEYRKKLSKEKRESYLKEFFKTYKRPKKDDDSYAQLQAQLDKDSLELSYNSCHISDLAFAKWNRQIFKYDKNSSDLVLKRNIVVSCDVPKRVSNVVNASTRKTIC